jgi:hypothetical protein
VASPSAVAAQAPAIVRLDPPTLEVGAGQTETIKILIENVKDLYGVEVRAHFDPSLFQVEDADPNQDGIQLIPGDFLKPDFLVRNTADNKKGTLEYVLTQTNPTPPANGTGTLVSIKFSGKTVGKTSPFAIDHVLFSDRRGKQIPATSRNGQLVVVQAKPPTPTPISTPLVRSVPTVVVFAQSLETPSASESSPRSVDPSGLSNISSFDLALGTIACGGIGGAFLILAVGGAIFLLRRPAPSRDPRRRP